MTTGYLASGYGFAEAGDLFLREVLLPGLLGCGIRVLDPWRHKEDACREVAEMDGDLVRMRSDGHKVCNNACSPYGARIAGCPCQHYGAVKSALPTEPRTGTPPPDEPRREVGAQ